MIYRAEIDGLRAVAVLPVIFYHAGFAFAHGGYIGVDVFFVISGYLITSLIVEEKRAGTFSLASFYERRMRRLLPALFIVLFAAGICAWMLFTPQQLSAFGASVVATSLFASNFYFLHQTDYFAPPTLGLPLVHTWSLAVEEQYYALFPLVLWLGWRRGIRGVAVIISTIALASFAWCEVSWRRSPDANFYLIFGRAWELMIGALAALSATRLGGVRASVRDGATIIGIALLGFSMAAFDDGVPFPSALTLIPVLGSVLLVLFATSETWIGRVLRSPLLVGVGLLSYSAYLWHQPVFAFLREYSLEEPSRLMMLSACGAVFVLAYLTWRFVEKPFRDRRHLSRAQITGFAIGISSSLIVLGSILVSTDGMRQYSPNYERLNAVADRKSNAAYVRERFDRLRKRPFDPADPRPRAIVVGDSFAEDLVNALFENGTLDRYQVQTWYVPARCQIVAMDFPTQMTHVDARDRDACEHADTLLDALTAIGQADLIVLAANWKDWSAEDMDHTVKSLNLLPHQKLLVAGSKSFGKISLARYYRMSSQQLLQLRHTVDSSQRTVNEMLAARLDSSVFVDLYALLCNDYVCPLFTNDLDLISYDGVHLTPAGARYLGELLSGHTAVQELQSLVR